MTGKARYLEEGFLSMVIRQSFMCGPTNQMRPAGKYKAEGEAPQLALQSCTDQAKAAMLAKQNEGMRCVHDLNLTIGEKDGK